MNTLFVAAGWFGFALTGALFVCALAWVLGDRRRAAAPAPEPASAPVPRIPAQRTPPVSAAVIVHPLDTVAYDEFLRELIITPHVEAVLSW